MADKFLTNSISEIEDFSVGASQTSSMRQWSLKVDSTDAMGTASYHIEFSHEFRERLTLCYMILKYVPTSGLEELKEMVGSVIEFYQDINQNSEFKLASPTTASYEVTYNEPVVRDVFSIGED